MMRGVFLWLDAHPGFYWAAFAAAVLAWVARCRALAARRENGGSAGDWVTGLTLLGVLLAGRWPELFVARGVAEEEARVLLGALGLAEPARPFQAVLFEGAGPLASAVLLPTHWLGVPQDYFNLRLVALGCDLITVGCLFGILRRRQGADAATVAAVGVLAIFLAGPWSERWAGELAMHLALTLTVAAAAVLRRSRERANDGIDFRAVAAGLIIAALPWVHRAAMPWAVGCAVAGAVWLRDSRRARWLAGAAVYGAAVTMAFVWGTGGWPDFWDGYVLRLSRATGSVTWWSGFGALVAGAAGSVLFFGWLGRGGERVRMGTVALAVALLAGLAAMAYGSPRMLGALTEHWRRPRTELASELRQVVRPAERVAVWGEISSALVEARLQSVTTFGIGDESDWLWQRRWFDAVRRSESGVLIVAAGARSERLRALLQDRYRRIWSGTEGEIHVNNERMQALVGRRPGAVPIRLGDLVVAEAFGGVSEIGEGRLAAHAPSRLTVRVPVGAQRIAGVFGFYPDAYRHAGRTTDGGKFSIAWLRSGGLTREVAVERWLTPAQKEDERGAQEFVFAIPSGTDAVEFKVETGATMSFDWAFWGELRFERASDGR